MNSFVKDFVREKICLYSPILKIDNFTELIKLAKTEGACGIEFLNYGEMASPDMKSAKELGKLAKANGLLLPCFSVGLNLVGDDRAENVPLVKKYAEICSELEIPYLHHTVAFQFTKPYNTENSPKYFAEGVEVTEEIADYAKRLGVKTVLEDQGFVINGKESYGKFRNEANRCFDVLLDTGNIYFVDETAGDFAESFAESVVHTHLKEYLRTESEPASPYYLSLDDKYLLDAVAGEGSVDFDRVKNALKGVGYKGVYSIEYKLNTVEEMHRTFEYLASVFGDV